MIVTFQYDLDGQTNTAVTTTDHPTAAEFAAALLTTLTDEVREVRVWSGTDTNRNPDGTATR